jgi:hypothetical protein
LFKMSNTCVATGRDEPCPYILSLSCNLVLDARFVARLFFVALQGELDEAVNDTREGQP